MAIVSAADRDPVTGPLASSRPVTGALRFRRYPRLSAVARARTLLPSEALSPLFQAALETTEEAVLNALLRATTVSGMGRSVEAIPLDRVRAALRKYGRPAPQGRAAER